MKAEDLQKPKVAEYLESIQREEMMLAIKQVCDEVVTDAIKRDKSVRKWVKDKTLETIVRTLAEKLVGEMEVRL
jgi:hypothetical protein